MYVVNNNFGIGKVVSETDDKVVVYFEDEDVTKTLLVKFTKMYTTFEEANAILNPELTIEDMEELGARAAQEEADAKQRKIDIARGAEIVEKNQSELMKSIY